MAGTGSEFGIYLIFKIKEGCDLKHYSEKIRETFNDCNNISVIEMDCTEGIGGDKS